MRLVKPRNMKHCESSVAGHWSLVKKITKDEKTKQKNVLRSQILFVMNF